LIHQREPDEEIAFSDLRNSSKIPLTFAPLFELSAFPSMSIGTEATLVIGSGIMSKAAPSFNIFFPGSPRSLMISLTSLFASESFGGDTLEETIPAALLINFAFFLAVAVSEDKYIRQVGNWNVIFVCQNKIVNGSKNTTVPFQRTPKQERTRERLSNIKQLCDSYRKKLLRD
jgi:hypothetical protein